MQRLAAGYAFEFPRDGVAESDSGADHHIPRARRAIEAGGEAVDRDIDPAAAMSVNSAVASTRCRPQQGSCSLSNLSPRANTMKDAIAPPG
ncbi:MAG: hypothetical protein QM661_01855 [Solimonas sp.]